MAAVQNEVEAEADAGAATSKQFRRLDCQQKTISRRVRPLEFYHCLVIKIVPIMTYDNNRKEEG